MQLKCLKCRSLIRPDEPMVSVIVASASRWHRGTSQLTPGRWHYRCAPVSIRAYVPPFTEEEDKEDTSGQ